MTTQTTPSEDKARAIVGEWWDKLPGSHYPLYFKQLDPIIWPLARLIEQERKIKYLFLAIEHGDEAHRIWLKQKIEEHFS